MVIEDCIECSHGEVDKVANEYYSKCNLERCSSMHTKCIARRALMNYYRLKEIKSIHIILREFQKDKN